MLSVRYDKTITVYPRPSCVIFFSACRKCALSGMSRLCRHRIKLGDKESYYYISPSSRARVIITFFVTFFLDMLLLLL